MHFNVALLLVIAVHNSAGDQTTDRACPECPTNSGQVMERMLKLEKAMERFNEKIDVFEDILRGNMGHAFDKHKRLDKSVGNIRETAKDQAQEITNASTTYTHDKVNTADKPALADFDRKLQSAMADLEANFVKKMKRIRRGLKRSVSKVVETAMETAGKQDMVVFTVTSPTGELNDQVPIFGSEVINVGGGHNSSAGVFVCPVPGIYHFFLALKVAHGGLFHPGCSMRRNGDQIMRVVVDADVNDVSAGAFYIRLDRGDIVDPYCTVWERVGTSSTTFSGRLVDKAH